MRTTTIAFIACFAALAGCQAPDVGAPCNLDFEVPQPVVADYLETGRTECDNLVCIRSQLSSRQASEAYCSKPCVADGDCSPSDTGLLCRKVVLDDAFLSNLDAATKQKYLGDTGQFSRYCAAPLPPQ